MIQSGDVRGAVRALDEARTIDPVAPGLSEVSQLMADRFKSQAQAARGGTAAIARSGAGVTLESACPTTITAAATEHRCDATCAAASGDAARTLATSCAASDATSPAVGRCRRRAPNQLGSGRSEAGAVTCGATCRAQAGSRYVDDDSAIRAVVADLRARDRVKGPRALSIDQAEPRR